MKISSVTSSPSSRSITQSITGRPATFSNGLGTKCVCGRSRVPLPARGMITCISVPSVTVLKPDEVVQLRCGGLEDIAVHHRLDLMDHLRGHVHRLARPERPGHQLFPCLGSKDQLAGQHVHRLILQVVVLKAEHMSRLDVKDLSDV